MLGIKKYLGSMVLCTAMLTPLLTSGCAARGRYYDGYYHDYHRWDGREDHQYRVWLTERHYEYRDFNRLDRDQQQDYWKWRHEHSDNH